MNTLAHGYDGYVGFFDMLGFGDAVKRNPDRAWDALSNLHNAMDRVLRLGVEIPRLDVNLRPPLAEIKIFSDSIVIFTLTNELKDLYLILVLGTELFAQAYHRCLPLRGGISHGNFHYDSRRNIFCGEPFVEGYEIGERAQWFGVTVHDKVATIYCKTPVIRAKHETRPAIIQWDTPVKGQGKEKRWVVNWPITHRHNFTVKAPISLQDFYRPFEYLFGEYEDLESDQQAKYENTVEFINSVLAQEEK